jgi:2-keto-3-deoxy-L-rhamnonate aldolase RhmA
MVIPMIEHIDAVAALDEILSVPGIDVIHCAPNDLAQSMGFPPEEEVVKVRKEVIAKCRAAGLPVGIGGNSPRNPVAVAELAKAGATFVTVPALGMLQLGADEFRGGVKAALSD